MIKDARNTLRNINFLGKTFEFLRRFLHDPLAVDSRTFAYGLPDALATDVAWKSAARCVRIRLIPYQLRDLKLEGGRTCISGTQWLNMGNTAYRYIADTI